MQRAGEEKRGEERGEKRCVKEEKGKEDFFSTRISHWYNIVHIFIFIFIKNMPGALLAFRWQIQWLSSWNNIYNIESWMCFFFVRSKNSIMINRGSQVARGNRQKIIRHSDFELAFILAYVKITAFAGY